jgi:hypothetical protein
MAKQITNLKAKGHNMSVFSAINSNQSKVLNSDYIRTTNEQDAEETKPAETTTPATPEAK